MAKQEFVSPDWHSNAKTEQTQRALLTNPMVYVRVDAVKRPLQRPYKGPFKVLARKDPTFTVALPDGTEDDVAIERLKPAFTDADLITGGQGLTYSRVGRRSRQPSRYTMRVAGTTENAVRQTGDREATLRLFNSHLDPSEAELGDALDDEEERELILQEDAFLDQRSNKA